MNDQNATIQAVREILRRSSNVVALLGVGTVIESGGENIWSARECYRIEEAYHKSPDEMMSVGYYSARRDQFFNFYKKEILGRKMIMKPAPLYKELFRMQRSGKLKKVITQNYYNMHSEAGLDDVVELHGNIMNNRCPHCGKKFSVDYIREAKGVPLCDECGTAIRPGILLYGETIGNNLMTEAVNACENAETILVLGTNMYDHMVQFCTGNYKGSHLILITKDEHFTDHYADYVIHGEVSEMLPKVTEM